MKEIIIRDAEGKQININVVRYFRLNGMEYLIFSLNETDEGGYVKLYVSKIFEGMGKTIEDDVEWNLIKDTIKTVIKSNKDSLPLPITDLDTNKINNIQVVDQKIFKLNDSLLQLLIANKKEEIIDEPTFQPEVQDNSLNISPVSEVDYEPIVPEVPLNVNVPSGMTTPMFDNLNQFSNPTPVVENMAPINDLGSVSGSTSDYAPDYKTLYENELKRNEELTREVDKYKNIITVLKNTLSQEI